MKFVDKLDFELEEPLLTEPNPADFLRPQESYPWPNPNTKSVHGKLVIYNMAGVPLAEFLGLEFEHEPVRGIHCAYKLSGTVLVSGKADHFKLFMYIPKEIVVRGEIADRNSGSGGPGLRLGTRHLTQGSQMKINFFEVAGLKGE